jgi:hypothetical protein
MSLAPRIARERCTDGALRLGFDDVHHAVLVGERPAQDDEVRIHEPVHERRVRGPVGLLLQRPRPVPPGTRPVEDDVEGGHARAAAQTLVAAKACLARSAISSGGTSSTCVEINHEWPNGSETEPNRSPQN